jgi:hypothetical protein
MRAVVEFFPTCQNMPSALPNYWRLVFVVLEKESRMPNPFGNLLEMLLNNESTLGPFG